VYYSCMAYKTISIDVETYELLKARKRRGQSFSDVIRSGLSPGGTGRDLQMVLGRSLPSAETVEALERIVAARRASPARVPEL
jgi:predicted CopG family antitoxin